MVALSQGMLKRIHLVESFGSSNIRSSTGRIALAPLERELKQFIDSSRSQYTARAWLENADMKVYVRKSKRFIEGKMVTALDIASVEVAPEKRSQGLFTRFLNLAHRMNPFDATYIENALDDRFAEYFWRRDWELTDDVTRCFYKKKNQGAFRDAWNRNKV